MSTSTFVASHAYTTSYAHTVTYVTTKILLLLKEIIREIGLDPAKFVDDWAVYEEAVTTWLISRHLERIRLEVYYPRSDKLVTLWDIDVVYAPVGDGSLWVDTAAIRYAIAKAGLAPSSCDYDIKVKNKPGRPHVDGWGSCDFRSTDGFKRYTVGATVGGNGPCGADRILEPMMLTPDEAFRKFRSNLELTQKEQDNASVRQKEIRALMDKSFSIADDFLTGSYKRWTKTKPLKDVDIFCVFADSERPKYRTNKPPSIILTDTERILADEYGGENVHRQRRSVSVDFPDSSGDEERVMSFDIVPAFTMSDHYEIPDTATSKGWTKTNPKIHAEKATAANEAFGGEWKGMVRMAKSWNRTEDKPVRPSFLIEVMALDILRPPFGGDFPYEFMSFFATMADRIDEVWPDPARLGPPVSDSMNGSERAAAKQALTEAHHMIREAIQLSRSSRNGDALRKYRELFGDRFPLS